MLESRVVVMSPVQHLAFVGRSGTGKTTLVTALIPRLVAAGLAVGSIKHHHGPLELDRPGKDSHRHAAAGSAAAVLVAQDHMAVFRRTTGSDVPSTIAARDQAELDLVLVEGFAGHAGPLFELVSGPDEVPRFAGDPRLIAIVMPGISALAGAGHPAAPGTPVLGRDDVEGLTRLVLAWYAERRRVAAVRFRLPRSLTGPQVERGLRALAAMLALEGGSRVDLAVHRPRTRRRSSRSGTS